MLRALALSICMFFHPVHVTLTSIDHVSGTDSLKVFVRMYYDDFLRDYRLFDTAGVSLNKFSGGKTFPADLMNNYLSEKVNISVNNKQLKGKLLNLVMADNEISINLLYKTVKKLKSISVTNMIMTGLYSDQANMTMIKIDDFEDGVKLTPEKSTESFNLK
ncbi:MAG TPA: DUF6702 family protein [Bacteroidales bacterium]|nr:DUF6702 family protein [Bacteroidales bacterium]